MSAPTVHPLVARVRAAEAVCADFAGQNFAWGSCDCVQMAHAVVAALGKPSPLARAGAYKSQLGAFKALKRAGFKTLDEALDGMGFARVPPAMTLPADILGFDSTVPEMGSALGVVLSNGRCLAFVDSPLVGGYRAVIGKAGMANVAWRVL